MIVGNLFILLQMNFKLVNKYFNLILFKNYHSLLISKIIALKGHQSCFVFQYLL